MKTLLVLAQHSGLADAIRAVLDPEQHRVVYQKEIWEAEALLDQGAIDACVLDAELTSIQPIRVLERLRRRMPVCPILVYATAKQWEWEEEAYHIVPSVFSSPAGAIPAQSEIMEECFEGR